MTTATTTKQAMRARWLSISQKVVSVRSVFKSPWIGNMLLELERVMAGLADGLVRFLAWRR